MPQATATTTATRIPQGGYHNIRNDGAVVIIIEPSSSITATSGGTILPGGVFSWDRDQPFWVITASGECVYEIF